MAAIPLAVSERSRRDLERICEIAPESMKAAITALASRKRPVISPNALRRTLESAVGDEAARVLVRQLISLRLLTASTRMLCPQWEPLFRAGMARKMEV
jgi:hypothetical protein